MNKDVVVHIHNGMLLSQKTEQNNAIWYNCFIHDSVYICQPYSLNSSHPPLPLYPQVDSLYLYLYSCPINKHICAIFLDSIHVLIGDIYFYLSDLLHSV